MPQNFSLMEIIEAEQTRIKEESNNEKSNEEDCSEDNMCDASTDESEEGDNDRKSIWLEKLALKACVVF